MRPLVWPVAESVIAPIGTIGTKNGLVKLPLTSAETVVVARPGIAKETCSPDVKLVPIAFTLVPGGPLYVESAKNAVVVPVVVAGVYVKVSVFDT